MSNTPQYYSKPFLFALSLHILVLAFLIFELSFSAKLPASNSSSGPIIQATAVSQAVLDNYEQQVKAASEAKIKEQQLQKQLEIQKQQQIQKQIQQQKLEAEKAVQAAKQQAEKAAKEAQINETKEMKKMLQKSLAQDLQKQLAKEQKTTSVHSASSPSKTQTSVPTTTTSTTSNQTASSTAINQGELDKYKALIIQAISGQWIVPPNLSQNISCELNVRVAPGGVVTEVTVIKSSGNPVLDNSAIAAVNKASPLPVPTEPSLFNQFRELHLTIKPDGSMTEN
jgi:colicin import membrane protein